ncbi:MAG: hypothetical protein KF693_01700 [Nitrospira sp.]|nr:hypothetical protein [Nitrospira sp.]
MDVKLLIPIPMRSLVIILLVVAACAGPRVSERETPRVRDVPPAAAVAEAVKRFKATDPDASFTFFNGHVDGFATTAKPTIPDYARPLLKVLGLPDTPRTPLKLPAPRFSGAQSKPARDLDIDFDQALPTLPERELGEQGTTKGESDTEDEFSGIQRPTQETRRKSPTDPDRLVEWMRPDEQQIRIEQQVTLPILEAFLSRYLDVFEVDQRQVRATLIPVTYEIGAYFRKAVFEQRYMGEEKLLYGRTLVHFDVNWNVIGISRMITTTAKLTVPPLAEKRIDQSAATRLAADAFIRCRGRQYETLRAEPAVDPVRRLRVWDVELLSPDGECHWRTIIQAATGEILNVTDLVDRAFTDAKINRWYFPGGNLFDPHQIVSTGIYTRNDRRLEHDFFYVMNDHRCEGDPETNCAETSFNSTWCQAAHGTYTGRSFIRATRRSNRDFDQYYPNGASEAFAETHVYYWARSYSQWLKASLDALGVLPGSANNYPRVLIITDACRDGSVHNSTYKVTTEDDKGEGTNVIRLAHRNPSGNSNHNAACEGGGCFDNPSNLQHELTHFFLKRYYDVGSDLDCGSANQLKFTHEGLLGTAVPQAYWHYYYGVGYEPSSTDRLYFSHTDTGRIHTDNASRMTIGNFLCVNNTDDPYRAGRVVGQALWEFYHGRKVSGSSIDHTWYPSTDKDFNILVFWAADLQAASTYKDRYEFANRVMEILDKHSNWSGAGKRDYCEIFEHHELRAFINAEYCE